MKKKITAMLLSLSMALQMTVYVGADEEPGEEDAVVPESAVCTICGTEDCTGEEEHEYCDICEDYDCGLTHEYCEVCEDYDCGLTHEYCDICGGYDCEVGHPQCEVCGVIYADTHECAICGDCGAMENAEHAHNCTVNCTCGTEDDVHAADCIVLCECDYIDAQHTEDCTLYVEEETVYDDLRARADELCGTDLSGLTEDEISALDDTVGKLLNEIDAAYDQLTEEQYWELINDVEAVMLALADAVPAEGGDAGTYIEKPGGNTLPNVVEDVVQNDNIKVNIVNYGSNTGSKYFMAVWGVYNNEEESYPDYVYKNNPVLSVDNYDWDGWAKDNNLSDYKSYWYRNLPEKQWPKLKNQTSIGTWMSGNAENDGEPEEADGSWLGATMWLKNHSNPYRLNSKPMMEYKLNDEGFPVIKHDEPSVGEISLEEFFVYNSEEHTGGANNLTDTGLFQKDKQGNYYFDSYKNIAVFDQSNNKFILYDGTLSPYFTPFNPLERDGKSVVTCTDSSQKKYNLIEPLDLGFGMMVEFDFYMPENGKIDDNDMIFRFLGDDDVWVYIDDVLVLDAGGTHPSRSCDINFQTGIVHHPDMVDAPSSPAVQTFEMSLKDKFMLAEGCMTIQYTTSDSEENMVEGSDFVLTKGSEEAIAAFYEKYEGVFTEDSDTFVANSRHTLKFFYMERGGSATNCSLYFNLNPIEPSGLEVKKEIDGIATDVTDTTYTFQLLDYQKNPVPNSRYYIRGDSAQKMTNEDGKFTLKAGQTADFVMISGTNVSYYIKEMESQYVESTSWTASIPSNDEENTVKSGTTLLSGSLQVLPNKTCSITFTNKLKTETVTVSKDVVGARSVDKDREYEFEAYVKVDDTAVKIANAESNEYSIDDNNKISFNLKDSEKVTLCDLPIGASLIIQEINVEDFTVKINEVPDDDKKYEGIIEYSPETAFKVSFENTPNRYDLTIRKTGLMEEDAQSATVFTVVGVDVNMTVIVIGNGSVVLKDLPVGTYTITEDTDWSWRYAPMEEAEKSVELNGPNKEVAFVNELTEEYWLDGSTMCRNVFLGEGKMNDGIHYPSKKPKDD